MQKERLRGFIEDDGSKSKLFGHCRVNTGKNAFFILREIKDSLIVRFFNILISVGKYETYG